ncbi:related to MFS transporter [Phialocephala subalpina]|uniref:Related to MFS transporter n=1 Tax=Phialocephala subalpina TaxID=576137 RepID=A0A1L7XA08_9HELO|nr:related to MFS transporter [Phialocephala subalpina]
MAFGTATAGDPKWWPAWIRYTVLANLCWFVFMGNCYSSGITTGFEDMAIEFRVGFGSLTDIVSWSVFALGVSNFFWMPLAMCIGKRPVILISMVIFLAGLIWSVYAPTLDSLLGARILASFGAGSVESLGPSMIADLFLERYFATAMALFALFLSGGSQIGPVIAGYLIADQGWRWFFKLCAILNAANLFFCLFFLPETSYRRPYVYSGETAAEADKEAIEMHEYKHGKNMGDGLATVPTGTAPGVPYAGSYWKDLVAFRNRGQEETGLRSFPKQLTLPWRFLVVPGAVYAVMSYGIMLGGIVIISSQIPQLFAPPPYLFDSKAIGLFTLASFIGVIVAYPLAGPMTDLLSRTLTRRNSNIHKPEHRIPALILPFLLCPWGLILYAYTVSEAKPYYAAAVGFAVQAAGLCFVPSVVLSYVVDAYPTEGGEALVLINAGKNLVAFGVTKGNAQWLASQGLKKMYGEMAAIQWAVLLLGLPLYFLGPWLRAKTQRFV